jgi:hypothetical protein
MTCVLRATLILVMVTYVLASPAMAIETSHALIVQISKEDVSSLEQSIKKSLESNPINGGSKTSIKSSYPLGTFSLNSYSYSLLPSLHSVQLQEGGIQIDLSVKVLNAQLDRVDFNQSGSNFCEHIPIRSESNPARGAIPVRLVLRPTTLPDGSVTFEVPVSEISLSRHNFIIGKPSKCDVLFGFNWLIENTLPSLLNHFRSEISNKLSAALVDVIKSKMIEVSPMLGINVTFPFEPGVFPSFYASIAAAPNAFSLNQNRFRSFISTNITFDPDVASLFEAQEPWPENFSFLGFNWELFNDLLKEAQTKKILQTNITQDSPAGKFLTSSELWSVLWPEISQVVPANSPMKLRLEAGPQLKWTAKTRQNSRLYLHHLKLTLSLDEGHDSRKLAELMMDASLDITFAAGNEKQLKAVVNNLLIDSNSVKIASKGALLDGAKVNLEGIKLIAELLRNQIQQTEESSRSLFNFAIPAINVGDHQFLLQDIVLTQSGIICPIRHQGHQ